MRRQLPFYLVAALLILMPFHAFLTVWLASAVGHYTLLRLWPEFVLVILALVSVPTIWRLRADRLVQLTLAFAAVIALAGLVAYGRGLVSGSALAQGVIIDGRLPLCLIIGLALAGQLSGIRRHWRRFILVPAALVIAFGVVQLFLPPHFLSHFGYGPGTISPFTAVDNKPDYQRIQSTLRGPNPLGAYMVLVVAAGSWLLIPALFVVALTYSRSAYIGCAAASAGLLFIARRRLFYSAAGGLLVIGAVSLVTLRHNDHFQNVFFHTDEHSTSATSSNFDRASGLREGARDVLREPLGRGTGTAGPASAHSTDVRISENFFLQIGQELGWVGLGLFVAIHVVLVGRLWRLRHDRLARALLASLLGLTLVNMLSHAWADDTISIIWWLLCGIALGQTAILKRTHEKTSQTT